MDETQASTKSTSDAGATRKRRSSILKSQRPPRTPLSELEFHVATPTDTAKSRRVSFSRRTGVAEFITNEATTTWKNFYEEQNKSLENSGNDSVVNPPRQMSIGHIGKRIFDQQFEEVEIVDIGGTLQPKSLAQDFHTSLNNFNITQQLASLECPSDDRKLTAPHQNFELSSFTDHQSKVFRDDLSIPAMPEMTNPININFSMQPLNSKNTCDDLDEIVKDLQRPHLPNVVCSGPFNGDNMSEYIEIDLNMTHVGMKNDEYEMSITDTIRNPEVQEVSKSVSSINNERNLIEKDWIVNKENIAVNPYVTPKESKNFAINESSDKILVFDGKKLTVKSERETLQNLDRKENFRSTLLPDLPTSATPKRKTIVLNTNDDLPNFLSNSSAVIENQVDNSENVIKPKQCVVYNENDLSITQAVSNKLDISKRKTIVFEDDMGNISVTQAVPAKVIINKQEKRKTIIYENDDANISVTQAVPANIIGGNKSIFEKRKTVVYENDISFTQALSENLILNDIMKVSDKDKTMYYQDVVDMSVTQVIPDKILNVVKNNSNLSITQAIPSNIITADIKPTDSAKTLIFDACEDIDIEITQAVSDNVLLSVKNSSEKRKTILFEDHAGDISVTQVVPADILLEKLEIKGDAKIVTPQNEEKIALNKSSIQSVPIKAEIDLDDRNDDVEKTTNKRKTIIYHDEAGDISMTKVMPSNIIMSKEPEPVKMETSSDHEIADISVTRALPTNILLQGTEESIKIFDTPLHVLKSEPHERSGCNLSMTKPIPSNIIDMQKELVKETDVCSEKSLYAPQTEDLLKNNLSIKQDIIIYQAAEETYSQSEIQSSVKTSPSEIESSIKESNESLVDKQNSITNESYVTATASKHSLTNNKTNISYIEEKQSTEIESVSKKNSAISEFISKSRDENLKAKKSFLNELLDMSNASLETVDRCTDVTAAESGNVEDKLKKENMESNKEGKSNESIFVITSDSEDDTNKENYKGNSVSKQFKTSYKDNSVSEQLKTSFINEPKQKETKSPPAIEYIEESEDVQDLHNKIAELKAVNLSKRTSNRHYERIVSSDTYDDGESLNKPEVKEKSMRANKKSFKYADDTRELLGMLSDFTEGENEELENNKSTPMLEMKENEMIRDNHESKQLSAFPKRHSIALSKEDLLNNISMAQAALQQSRFEVNEDESIEETCDSPEVVEAEKSRRKSVRISSEVVKTLQFEGDDSISEESLKTSIRMSPLKKTAFGETSYMRESKAKVIPSYLKDVSDNLKALMSDLVKPMADVMPFETVGLDKSLKPSVSTCSTQIQANLFTSSQIDVDVELHSVCESVESIKNIETNRSPNRSVVEKSALQNKVDHSLTRPVHSVSISASMEIDHSPTSPILQTTNVKHPIPRSSVKGPVIVFDHNNPLNNVLLAPVDDVKIHKYNPIKSTDTMHSEQENFTQMDEKANENFVEVERLSTHYNVDSKVCQQSALQSGDNCVESLKDTCSLVSNVSKPTSVDRSTEGLSPEVKSTEVNTMIAMKGNKELLEASSSLTLVDDALARSVFDIKIDCKTKENGQKSPLRVIYHMETESESLDNIDSDVTSSASNVENDSDSPNSRKRSYSPTKANLHNKSNIEITPKPVNKMQKMSKSPTVSKKINERLDELLSCLDKMESVPNINESPKAKTKEKSPKKKSPKHNKVVVQRVSTEYNRDTASDKEPLESVASSKTFGECVKRMEEVESFTSSRHAREMQDVDNVVSRNQSSYPSSNASSVNCMDWQTDLDVASSRNISECSSNVNVVDRINMLKCMGSCDCEWESSSGDVWNFRLLRSRIRLTARLSHRHHNASRSRVLADTPVEAVTVEPVRQEAKDPLATLAVRFAADAMRYECAREGRAPTRAAHLVPLLRRCAHVARVAVRWARVMRDARARLAYALTADGDLTLKVANIPLRTLWEVSLRLELVVGDAQEGAWPRAARARARAVLPGAAPADVAALAAHAPRDWRHAPATIWSVFRYLKNKSQDDDQFLGL